MPDELVAWLRNEPVAVLQRRSGRDDVRLIYNESTVDRSPAGVPALSCSLPLGRRPLDATAFVDGVLTEGDVRRVLAERAPPAAHDSFGLLARYGRDIVGAVQFVSPEHASVPVERWDVEELDSVHLEELVVELPANPLGVVAESELSLAGLQDKALLVDLGAGRWGRPLGGRPSTHILKCDSARHPGIVAAEAEALALARHAGLTSVASWLEVHGDFDCLVVERFDRVLATDGSVRRVHQEDACQALGVPPTQKYECTTVAGAGSSRRSPDCSTAMGGIRPPSSTDSPNSPPSR